MEFHSREKLESMESIALLWEQYHVLELSVELEKRIMEINGEINEASAQLQEATRRRHTVVFPFEDQSRRRRENPVLRRLRQNLLQKYEDVKKAETSLFEMQKYCDLIWDVLG